MDQICFMKIDKKITYLLNDLNSLTWIWPKLIYTQFKPVKNMLIISYWQMISNFVTPTFYTTWLAHLKNWGPTPNETNLEVGDFSYSNAMNCGQPHKNITHWIVKVNPSNHESRKGVKMSSHTFIVQWGINFK